jgi:RND superfamily putative drug exporter
LRALLAPLGVLLDTFVVRTLLVPALAVDVGPRALVAQRPGSPTSRTDNRRRIGRAGRAVARRLT